MKKDCLLENLNEDKFIEKISGWFSYISLANIHKLRLEIIRGINPYLNSNITGQ